MFLNSRQQRLIFWLEHRLIRPAACFPLGEAWRGGGLTHDLLFLDFVAAREQFYGGRQIGGFSVTIRQSPKLNFAYDTTCPNNGAGSNGSPDRHWTRFSHCHCLFVAAQSFDSMGDTGRHFFMVLCHLFRRVQNCGRAEMSSRTAPSRFLSMNRPGFPSRPG